MAHTLSPRPLMILSWTHHFQPEPARENREFRRPTSLVLPRRVIWGSSLWVDYFCICNLPLNIQILSTQNVLNDMQENQNTKGCLFTFRDSNTQWLFPSSSIWFHQRRPTISLPVTFLTAQKSHDNNKIIVTIQAIKLLLNNSQRR